MIEVDGLAIQSGAFRLSGVSFRIETGQYAVLMGRTGHGKTSILETICGLRRAAAGRIRINGTDITTWSPSDRQIGYVPQDLALFPTFTVRGHLEFAPRLQRLPAGEIAARVAELSELLGIAHLLPRSVRGLSGGESQRVALGRALSARPAVLLLDEPLSALDESTRLEMHGLLRQIHATSAVTFLHVTHNSEEADALADRRLILQNGALTEAAG